MAFYSTPSGLVRFALATNPGSVNGELAGGNGDVADDAARHRPERRRHVKNGVRERSSLQVAGIRAQRGESDPCAVRFEPAMTTLRDLKRQPSAVFTYVSW
jgi:hypothetical protein